ncbi:MAG: hypothetical protein ABSC49_02685 [Candidatus Microgenomates bacterium]|jgi:protein-tyrosine phosphatase
MEAWQFRSLIEKNDETHEERILGGAIDHLSVVTAEGQLDVLEITPADIDQIKEENWNNQYVCLKLADRRIWFDEEEVKTVISLLKTAIKAAKQNVTTAVVGKIADALL